MTPLERTLLRQAIDRRRREVTASELVLSCDHCGVTIETPKPGKRFCTRAHARAHTGRYGYQPTSWGTA